jgi:hypothetical protein
MNAQSILKNSIFVARGYYETPNAIDFISDVLFIVLRVIRGRTGFRRR